MNNQSSYQIIIDIGYPITRELLQKTVKVLNATFQLISSIKRDEEKYYIGISAINDIFCRIYAFKYFEGNSNLANALQQMETMMRTISQINEEEYNDLLHLAIKTALDDFNCFFKKINSAVLCDEESHIEDERQLNILLISFKMSYKFDVKLEKVNSLLSANSIKSIRVLKVLTDEKHDSEQDDYADDDEGDKETDHQITVVEEFKIGPSLLENYLKKYFFESNCCIGHLVLTLPEIILYCDMTSFMINIKHNGNTSDTYYNLFHSSHNNEYRMEVINRVNSDGICESHIYGFPIKITPAEHLKCDRNRYITNQQIFMAVTHSLIESDEYFILKYTQYNESQSTNHFFMLRPGHEDMLMKSLIPWELMSPQINVVNNNQNERIIQETDEQTKQAVNNSLAQVVSLYKYNPMNFKASILKSTLQLSSQTTKVTKRKLLPTFSTVLPTKKRQTSQLLEKKRKLNLIPPTLTKQSYKFIGEKRTDDERSTPAAQENRKWFKSFNDFSNYEELREDDGKEKQTNSDISTTEVGENTNNREEKLIQ